MYLNKAPNVKNKQDSHALSVIRKCKKDDSFTSRLAISLSLLVPELLRFSFPGVDGFSTGSTGSLVNNVNNQNCYQNISYCIKLPN